MVWGLWSSLKAPAPPRALLHLGRKHGQVFEPGALGGQLVVAGESRGEPDEVDVVVAIDGEVGLFAGGENLGRV